MISIRYRPCPKSSERSKTTCMSFNIRLKCPVESSYLQVTTEGASRDGRVNERFCAVPGGKLVLSGAGTAPPYPQQSETVIRSRFVLLCRAYSSESG